MPEFWYFNITEIDNLSPRDAYRLGERLAREDTTNEDDVCGININNGREHSDEDRERLAAFLDDIGLEWNTEQL